MRNLCGQWQGAMLRDKVSLKGLVSSDANEEARMNPSDLETIFDAVDCGICVLDGMGNTVGVNPGACRVSGIPKNVFLADPIMSLYDSGYFLRVPISYQSLVSGKIVHGMQRTKAGKTLTCTAVPVYENSRNVKYVVLDARERFSNHESREQLGKTENLNLACEQIELQSTGRSHGQRSILAGSQAMRKVLDVARRVAATDVTVLLLGESGVGKDLIAEYIHDSSPRRGAGEYVRLNCNSIPRELVESELFGYTEGAFTGASRRGKPGLLETLSRGTLFLDEIADLPLDLQGKFLDVVEKGAFRRVGGTKEIPTDVRIIAATNRELHEMARQGLFRQDLYYRMNVVTIRIPALRERVEDIRLLASYYTAQLNRRYNSKKVLSEGALRLLETYRWPGNVRELANFLECLTITVSSDDIRPEHFELTELGAKLLKPESPYVGSLSQALQEAEKRVLFQAKRELGSSRRVADALGISHTTVNNKLKKYALDDEY